MPHQPSNAAPSKKKADLVVNSPGSAVISASQFDAAMAALGSFESCPHVAVAVSGGSNSMALALLADDWVRQRQGRLTALIVDHGLRAESADEAKMVAGWLRQRDIAAEILHWDSPHQGHGIQAAARHARYRLLAGYCRQHSILHLLVGHHADDQAETIALRQDRHSGPDGLAGMAAIREGAFVRLLRPLLSVTAAALQNTCRAAGQEWLEDPSNRDTVRFARPRVRQALQSQPDQRNALLQLAADAAAQRRAQDRLLATVLARHARFYPDGRIELARVAITEHPALAGRLLTRVLMGIGNRAYPPRGDRLARLVLALQQPGDGAWTLSGCKIRLRQDSIYIQREGPRRHLATAPNPEIPTDTPFTAPIADQFAVPILMDGPL